MNRSLCTGSLLQAFDVITAGFHLIPWPSTWLHTLDNGSSPPSHRLREEFAAQRAAGLAELRTRFKRAIADDDLPADADADALARYVQTVNFGLTVQPSTGATRKELLRIVEISLKTWPK